MISEVEVIRVRGAREHNLADVDLEIPRRSIVVFTGVSGSGKSSLVFATIAAEAQRQLNETFTAFVRNRLPNYGRPDVDAVEGLSPVVVIDQRRLGGNARSTLSTATDINALLRLVFSRVGHPRIGESTAFSFNDPAGMCLTCAGLGVVVSADETTFLDTSRTLETGAILLPGFRRGQYRYRKTLEAGFPPDTPLREWPAARRRDLLRGTSTSSNGSEDFEGLLDEFTRIYINIDGPASSRKQSVLNRFTTSQTCPACGGARLNEAARSVKVGGHTITELTAAEIADLIPVIKRITDAEVTPVVHDLVKLLGALNGIDLGYLTLDRATTTLSGGESQRVKMVRHLGSSLTEMLYVFDEPSIGLHPADVERLTKLLRQLRDKGNTVLVVEHDPDVIAIADHVVDLGPAAGSHGGTVTFEGTVAQLRRSDTVTGASLRSRAETPRDPRTSHGRIPIRHATAHKLRDLDVDIPAGVLTVLTGVAGSGKSSLAGVLVDQHPDSIVVDQRAVATNRRSNPATYTGIADPIRTVFARAHDVPASLFSANSDGACPECRGQGVIYTDLAFMEGFSATCPRCHGRRFTDAVLAYRVDGRSIADVLELTVDDAAGLSTHPAIAPVLTALADVGLGYLTLGQPLNTLSGGECQRIKLATELHRSRHDALYVLDEPTTGLHPADVTRLLGILDRLIDDGITVVVVEHNLDVIRHADWIIDLGPGAGHHGGRLLHAGPPADLARHARSVTGRYL